MRMGGWAAAAGKWWEHSTQGYHHHHNHDVDVVGERPFPYGNTSIGGFSPAP